MTSHIKSTIEYLIATGNILMCLLHSNLILKSLLLTGFQHFSAEVA